MFARSGDQRDALSEALEELAREDDRIIALSADMGSRIIPGFIKKYPDRFFNFGIAEQGMLGAAAGLALSGFVPFVTTLACFLSMRTCEQVRTDIAYPRVNVKIVGTGGGLSYGNLGSTHQALEDISLMRAVANLVVMAPADVVETKCAVKAAAKYDGPVYIRLGRGAGPVVHEAESIDGFRIGKAIKLRHGKDVTLIATGTILSKALMAADALESVGIHASVLSMHTVKPLDREAVLEAATETGGIVTVEDNTVIGGLGSAVAELLSTTCPTRLRIIGIPDTYTIVGSPEDLYREYHMDVPDIVAAAKEILQR